MRCNTGLFWRMSFEALPDDDEIQSKHVAHDKRCAQCKAHLQRLVEEYCERHDLEPWPEVSQ
jgi:hypothetical protein